MSCIEQDEFEKIIFASIEAGIRGDGDGVAAAMLPMYENGCGGELMSFTVTMLVNAMRLAAVSECDHGLTFVFPAFGLVAWPGGGVEKIDGSEPELHEVNVGRLVSMLGMEEDQREHIADLFRVWLMAENQDVLADTIGLSLMMASWTVKSGRELKARADRAHLQ